MKRRTFVGLMAACTLAPSILLAGETLDYSPGLIKKELAAGHTVFVDYSAVWCSTCKRQERIINQLRSSNTIYDQNLTFVKVDWDKHGDADVTTSRNIPRRSTLLVLKGDKELGRIVAGTDPQKIKELIEKGL